ncbi:MAG: hypothetical protein IKP45_06925 [Bacteroidales bacterium]|nr:hypothetical protein [Bacteroidales bacterium]
MEKQDKKTERNIHIGKLIEHEFREQGRSATWLAKRINCTRTNIYKIFDKGNIDVYQLREISLALGVDFFKILSQNTFEDT